MGGLGMRELVVVVALFVAVLRPYARIFSRAGYSPWICLLMIVPLINIITIWIFAYAEWPALTTKSATP
jgi:uncharacterized membrane protein YhaH (DUF805 family)